MKKLLFSLSTLLLFASLVSAQEDPEKALAKAGRALSSYHLDPANNLDKLNEAANMIKIAAESDVTKGKYKTWETRGNIYSAFADKDLGIMSLGVKKDFVPEYPDASRLAAESFAKALGFAEKKYEIKEATTGLKDSSMKLNAMGNNQIQRLDYMGAYNSLAMVSTVNDLLVSKGEPAIIKDEDKSNHNFVVAYCAHAAGMKEEANKLFKELYLAGSEEESVYAQYGNMLSAEGKDEEALTVLQKGYSKFAGSSEILFSMINIYIKKGDTEKLKEMLTKAVDAEPNNPSVHAALGNVFMQLFTKEFATDRKSATAQGYFNEALKYFNNAVSLDPNMFDAIYSIGSLHFNRAVELIKYAGTLDIKQQKEYDAVVKEATDIMGTALPYFQKSEALNANDTNTLIALSEIFARMSDFEKSTEFKKRLETVRTGGENPSSYFKQ